jgi:hypothetical protein
MRYGLALLVGLVWGLWFGGLVMLFLAISYLFKADRAIAVQAAPRVFDVFATYQILLAAVAVIAAAAWRLTTPRAVLTALFSLVAIAAVGAVIVAAVITPRMQKLRLAGESHGPEFRRLHGQSMMVYTTETVALLVAGACLAAGLRSATTRPAPTPSNAPAPTSPPGITLSVAPASAPRVEPAGPAPSA